MMHEDERTLYLNEKRGLVVRRDGPSLWIKEKGRAGKRVPARLINMVLIFGNIKIDTGTLTLFTENNIPVTFMSNKGETLGVAMPGYADMPFHSERQRLIFESDRTLERYKTWLTAMRKKLQVQTMKSIAYPLAVKYMDVGFRDRDYRACIDKIRKRNGQRWQAAQMVVGNLFIEMTIKKIIDAGLDPHAGARNRLSHFGFAHDLCYVMLPAAELLLVRYIESSDKSHFIVDTESNCLLSREGIKHLIHEFERNKGMLRVSIDNIIIAFLEFLRGV